MRATRQVRIQVLQQQLIAEAKSLRRQLPRRLINPPLRRAHRNVFGNQGYIITHGECVRASERTGPENSLRCAFSTGGDCVERGGARGKKSGQDSPFRGCHAAWPRVACEAGPESHSQTGGARCDASSRRASGRLLLLLL